MTENTSQDEIIEQLLKILQERGEIALELARKAVLEEEIESKEVKEALIYFINEYWHDVTRPALFSLVCESHATNTIIITIVSISWIILCIFPPYKYCLYFEILKVYNKHLNIGK